MNLQAYLETARIVVLGIVTVVLGDYLKDPWLIESGKFLFAGAVGYAGSSLRNNGFLPFKGA